MGVHSSRRLVSLEAWKGWPRPPSAAHLHGKALAHGAGSEGARLDLDQHCMGPEGTGGKRRSSLGG